MRLRAHRSRLKSGYRLAAVATLLLGIAIGALLTFTAIRYRPSLLEVWTGGDTSLSAPGERGFASRLSYELSRVPEAPRAAGTPVRTAEPDAKPAASPVVAAPPAAKAAAEEALPGERITNARPITPVPPEPRDRTREIQRESRKPEYRDVPRHSTAPAPKVVEGREVPLKLPAKPAAASPPLEKESEETKR